MSRAARERWAALRDQSNRTGQAFERAADRLEAATASSELGTVTVELDPRGAVRNVKVEQAWTREAGPAELGALVLQVMGLAQAERFGKWAETAELELDEPAPLAAVDDIGRRARAIKGAAGDFLIQDAIREVGGLSGAVDEMVEAIKQVAVAEHSGRSAGRHVTARANGRSEIVSLEFDQAWLERAHSFNIGREATEAIEKALRAAASSTLEQVIAETRLGRLRELLTEPDVRRSDTTDTTDPEGSSR